MAFTIMPTFSEAFWPSALPFTINDWYMWLQALGSNQTAVSDACHPIVLHTILHCECFRQICPLGYQTSTEVRLTAIYVCCLTQCIPSRPSPQRHYNNHVWTCKCDGWLEFNVPFQHKDGYISQSCWKTERIERLYFYNTSLIRNRKRKVNVEGLLLKARTYKQQTVATHFQCVACWHRWHCSIRLTVSNSCCKWATGLRTMACATVRHWGPWWSRGWNRLEQDRLWTCQLTARSVNLQQALHKTRLQTYWNMFKINCMYSHGYKAPYSYTYTMHTYKMQL